MFVGGREVVGQNFENNVSKACILTLFETIWNSRENNKTMSQWVARLTRSWSMPVSHEFEPQQRPPLFPGARNFTLIA